MPKIVDTDVLVIGSGSAGLQAAVKASDYGVDVLVITKNLLSRGCCSRGSGTHWGSHDPSRVSLTDAYHLGTHLRLVDHEILSSILEYAPVSAGELEKMGIYWRRKPDGRLSESRLGYPGAGRNGETGQRLMDALYSETLRRGIEFMEETTGTSLLTKDGRCVGATALDYINGDFLAVRAKSVILATGHVGYIYRYSTQAREITGDGVSMAYQAGAEVANLEFQHWHHSDLLYPESARRLVQFGVDWGPADVGQALAEKMQSLGASKDGRDCLLVDAEGKDILTELRKLAATDDTFHSPDIQREIAKRYGKRGGLFMKFFKDVVDAEEFCKYYYYYPIISKFFDLKNDLIPLGTQAHSHAGGVRINIKCESSIPGLYAAGGVAGIYPTVNTCLWGGEASAKHASERAKRIAAPELDLDQISREEERVESFLRLKPSDGLTPPQVKRKIRDLMWDKSWIVKTVAGLKEGLEGILKIREEVVPQMGLETTVRKGNLGWAEALDVTSLLIVCELVIRAHLTRKESRGSHYVLDYPEQDDENWIKTIIIKLGEDGRSEIRVEPAVNPGVKITPTRAIQVEQEDV